jgi:hypothetical protein
MQTPVISNAIYGDGRGTPRRRGPCRRQRREHPLFYEMGHGLCSNPYWHTCPHRMACVRCEFYVPGEENQRAQEREPEGAVLTGTHIQSQDLSLSALCLDSHRDNHRHRRHPTVLAGLEVGGVEPHVGIRAFQRPAAETFDLLIELLAELGDPAFGDATHPKRLHQIVHLARRDPMYVSLLNHRG